MSKRALHETLSAAQVGLLTGTRNDCRLRSKEGRMFVDFHCTHTTIARALWRKGICSGDIRVRGGTRRVVLTVVGERVLARLLSPSGEN